ncbi:MAG: 30S ribosomal protein S17e [Methanophagales archaeon]|nr:30S ribosomal protein S17e [Methanophagales archaeon]RJS71713.1 MAG: 30S ribosomal protein S17e [Methanophagales archaeon]
MGTIKPTYVKKLAKQLLKEVAECTDDFELNKKLVDEYTNVESKGVRNRIAGYITHKKKGRGAEPELEPEPRIALA